MPARRIKVAILGGGVGGLTAAYYLSHTQDLRERYEVTVYSDGWALGGKCASPRNPKENFRIEEHGLHMLMGFYENAFRMMKDAYENRPVRTPFPTVRDAFRPRSYLVFEEVIDGEYVHWPLQMPENSLFPGEGSGLLSMWWKCVQLLKYMERLFVDSPLVSDPSTGSRRLPEIPGWLSTFLKALTPAPNTHLSERTGDGESFFERYPIFNDLLKAIPDNFKTDLSLPGRGLLWLVEAFMEWVKEEVEELDHDIRRLVMMADTCAAVIRGIITDGLLTESLDTIDKYDFSEWLKRHGCRFPNSAPVRVFYSACFAFPNSDYEHPKLAAGVALRGLLRFYLDYRGAVAWQMNGGMGEMFIAPMYQTMLSRGVKFEFFRRADRIELTPDRSTIARVQMGIQAKTKDGRPYEPLFDVDGLPCWPSEPHYDQLENGDQIRELPIKFDWPWPTPDVETETLELGRDFDLLVLAIPPQASRSMTHELVAANPKWQRMYNALDWVPTLGIQLWSSRTLSQLGWELKPPVLGRYDEPLDSWADMSNLLEHEKWPSPLEGGAATCAYIVGVRPKPTTPIDELTVPEKDAYFVKVTENWINRSLAGLWPNAGSKGDFDWNVLTAPKGVSGPERLKHQHISSCQKLSDGYVLSLPGTTEFRLKAGDSGFSNLYLAGDWIHSGMNGGCVEGTVQSGMSCARAISREDLEIVGEYD
jgi:uncharacterized protein with NAD-binding domain and iron-sulfur cluster